MQRKHNKALVPYARELRRSMTKEERRLWYEFLKSYPVKFLRQKIIGAYIVDFYCAKVKLAIELDGSQHYTNEGEEYDKARTDFLKSYGVTILRIPNTAIAQNFFAVCEYIDQTIRQSLSQRC